MATDPSSHSNFGAVRVSHEHFELDVNFSRKVIEGYATITATVESDDAPRSLILDTSSGLSVSGVHHVVGTSEDAMEWSLGEAHAVLGTPLIVSLPPGLPKGASVTVGVRFATAPTSSAIQFLSPEQTAGRTHPYLFTQCQAIHARALLPCQDSPGAKMSYSAVVRVSAELTALMSAVPADDTSAVAG
ncbi:hypothetical protein FOA52_008450 [Chlamydomonas sp. UWO 241]|nr:hypothetical protein FOA52_008450 [Chlamydomonas sp. UWO 241]